MLSLMALEHLYTKEFVQAQRDCRECCSMKCIGGPGTCMRQCNVIALSHNGVTVTQQNQKHQ